MRLAIILITGIIFAGMMRPGDWQVVTFDTTYYTTVGEDGCLWGEDIVEAHRVTGGMATVACRERER